MRMKNFEIKNVQQGRAYELPSPTPTKSLHYFLPLKTLEKMHI